MIEKMDVFKCDNTDILLKINEIIDALNGEATVVDFDKQFKELETKIRETA